LQQLQGAIALAEARVNFSQPRKDAGRDDGLFRGREEFGSFPAKWRPDRPIEWCRICRAEETRHGQSPHRASNAPRSGSDSPEDEYVGPMCCTPAAIDKTIFDW
jgi:hypothetical protein